MCLCDCRIYDGLIGLARPLLSAEVGRGEDRVLPDTLAGVFV